MDLIGFRPLCTSEQYKSLFLFPEACSKGTFTSYQHAQIPQEPSSSSTYCTAWGNSSPVVILRTSPSYVDRQLHTQPQADYWGPEIPTKLSGLRFNKFQLRLCGPASPGQACCSHPSTTAIPPYPPPPSATSRQHLIPAAVTYISSSPSGCVLKAPLSFFPGAAPREPLTFLWNPPPDLWGRRRTTGNATSQSAFSTSYQLFIGKQIWQPHRALNQPTPRRKKEKKQAWKVVGQTFLSKLYKMIEIVTMTGLVWVPVSSSQKTMGTTHYSVWSILDLLQPPVFSRCTQQLPPPFSWRLQYFNFRRVLSGWAQNSNSEP